VIQGKLKTEDKAMVQVYSNFNCIENQKAIFTPKDLVSNYALDPSQGAAASFGVPGAALLRAHYPFREDEVPSEKWGQLPDREVQLLDELLLYVATQAGKARVYKEHTQVTAETFDDVLGSIRVGLHTDAEVVFTRGADPEVLKVVHRPFPLVDQVLSSSLNWNLYETTYGMKVVRKDKTITEDNKIGDMSFTVDDDLLITSVTDPDLQKQHVQPGLKVKSVDGKAVWSLDEYKLQIRARGNTCISGAGKTTEFKIGVALEHVSKEQLEILTRALLRAAYDGAYLAAINRERKNLILAFIGGGSCGNPSKMIYEEMVAAHRRWARHPASQLTKVSLVLHDRGAAQSERSILNTLLQDLAVPPGFKTADGQWTEEAKKRFFGEKNETAMTKWASTQRSNYKDAASEKGKALREKYATEKDLEAFIKETYDKKYDALVGKASKSPRCFLDVTIADEPVGRLVVILFGNEVPMTAENFRQLCTHEKGFGYRDSTFHRVIPKFICQGGDITSYDGQGGKSIYADKFDDENFKLTHSARGILAMANDGPDTNNSQFYITFREQPHIDGKNVVFGKLDDSSMDVFEKIEKVGTESGKTTKNMKDVHDVKIVDCGELALKDWP